MTLPKVSRFREFEQNRADEFYARGYRRADFFPHRIYYLPKCGPDAFKLSRRIGECHPSEMFELILYAGLSITQQFPEELFFDDDVIWHQQHFGKLGQVATANLILKGNNLYSMAHVSDLVQRISRWREHKTRIEKLLQGWSHMLLNGILNFARERSVDAVYVTSAELAIAHTDPKRMQQRELFDRVYNRNVQALFNTEMINDWWRIDLKENMSKVVIPDIVEELVVAEKTICVCHDIEYGLGHQDSDPALAEEANRTGAQALQSMLAIEQAHTVKASYNVVGQLFPSLREPISLHGHCLGFHSFNHAISRSGQAGRPWPFNLPFKKGRPEADGAKVAIDSPHGDQLEMCRKVDYRVKGYRPPQSTITADIADERLLFHNFEWIASSFGSLGTIIPRLENCLVKIPIAFDDYELYRSDMEYGKWEQQALEAIEKHDFVAFSLHDCYARYWLNSYEKFLERVKQLGRIKTLDEVAADVLFANAL